MNIKTALISILSMIISMSAMADPQQIGMGASVAIAADSETADCDHDVLATYTGPTDMEADWTANTINLHWYNDNKEIDTTGTNSATCTYDGSITLPATDPIKTGYTFIGWQVRAAAQTLDCSVFDQSECESHSEECVVYNDGFGDFDSCYNRVETQYTKCSDATTPEECSNVTDEAGRKPCGWQYSRCLIKTCDTALNGDWCEPMCMWARDHCV